ncbi:TIGR03088 family PEP-CTERM/XrtA system glycosyltransferase [Ectothiorhodospira mobilis]|uniref:TIGR03088 family PEP-CTERM/XrtA system glycosyltransferase n=1 Tax=Ectothiorhodospira mobilis TaxID=195064 RepID=UPI001EE98121|nr:TIGR03088 family PEP-CTERM/XrtA system glycosyltransferase [Ectothiorhodospira mobilis]MCG5535549.1 TIGR03088 family PEP-CTERM/XrtA system glycosyltransferase [Ectothiorhodospira mobilis]
MAPMTEADPPTQPPPLVAHVIHRLDVGGMENGLVNLINHMPPQRYRHAILCMTGYTGFARRLQREDVSLHALDKREGKDPAVHLRLWRLLRRLRPAIVHTRNLATLEAQATAALAGVRRRVHGEHGWNVGDLDGSGEGPRRMRRLLRPLVGQYIALSRHQMDYLAGAIGVPADRLNHICNGVDTGRFHPPQDRAAARAVLPPGFAPPGTPVFGAVMRLQAVKAPEVLLQAFLGLLGQAPPGGEPRLVMVGDGPLLRDLRARLDAAGAAHLAWLPGARDDIPEILRALDVLVLPSLAEGICNTVLEAMATGLPVIATHVGGNPDLIRDGRTGLLVPPGDAEALMAALARCLGDPAGARALGAAARAHSEQALSLEAMVQGYLAVYDRLMAG